MPNLRGAYPVGRDDGNLLYATRTVSRVLRVEDVRVVKVDGGAEVRVYSGVKKCWQQGGQVDTWKGVASPNRMTLVDSVRRLSRADGLWLPQRRPLRGVG